MKYKKTVTGALVLAGTLTLAACGGNSSASSGSSKTLNMVQTSSIDSLDPVLGYETSSCTVIGNTYEGLYSVDNSGNVKLALASKVKTSSDGLTQTYTIRKNAKWSNGDDVTAEDFVFAWKRLADPKEASAFNFELGAAGIKNADDIVAGKMSPDKLGVEAKDKKTLAIHYASRVPYVKNILSFSALAPVDKSYYQKTGKKFAQDSQHLVAAGPYKVSKWKSGDNTITLVKNNKYWDAKSVKVDKVKIQVITDPEKAAIAYQNGTVDYTPLSSQLASKYKKTAGYKNQLGNFTQYLMFNMANSNVNNTALHQAIAYSINKQTIVKDVLKDGSEVANSMIMKNLVTDPGTNKDFASESTKGYTYSPAKAKAAWAKAKQQTSTRSITLMYDDSDPAYANVAAYIKAQVEKNLSGFKVNLQQVTKKTRSSKLSSGAFDVMLTRWGPDYADPTAILTMYRSDNNSNYMKWVNKDFDAAMDQAAGRDANDSAKRYQDLLKANDILVDSAACPPLYQISRPVLQRSSVHGLVNHLAGVPYRFKYVTVK